MRYRNPNLSLTIGTAGRTSTISDLGLVQNAGDPAIRQITVDWGDGSPLQSNLAFIPSNQRVHTYAGLGAASFTVTVTVTPVSGSPYTVTQTVSVQ